MLDKNMQNNISEIGGKRPLVYVNANNLHLDPLNPRLPEDIQNKGEEDICYALYRFFDIEELAYSMAENGYFDEEPLVAIPQSLPIVFHGLSGNELMQNDAYIKFIKDQTTQFVVVEGNRRLSTIKLLLSAELRKRLKINSIPEITAEIVQDISNLPVIIYPNRKEVLPYLGVRHISGIKKWEPYAKARYIAHMVNGGYSMSEVQTIIADRSNSARKFYLCYKMTEQVNNENDFYYDFNKNEFSYLLLSVGQNSIKEFLGIPQKYNEVNYDSPVPVSNSANLKLFFSWLYGDSKNEKVLKDSRDITNFLTHVVSEPLSLNHLRETRDLQGAYERSGGEEQLLNSYISKANINLEKSLQFIHRHKGSEVIEAELKKCKDTLDVIFKILLP